MSQSSRWTTCSRDDCRGPGTVLMTANLARPASIFRHRATVDVFREALGAHILRRGCEAPAYCFMPDHLHLASSGLRDQSDAWLAVVDFKRETGEWLRETGKGARWQSGFDVRLLCDPQAVEDACFYVWNNPVVAGLARAWQDYEFSGEIREAR